ncbi:MAG: DUF4931 domain-containing protein [Candidatus Acidoferrales bacterium]
MARVRMDPTSWLWIIAGEPPVRPSAAPPRVADCPFCPAADLSFETLITEKRDFAGAWTIRVLVDRAPVLQTDGNPERLADGVYDHMNAVGAHEIVVEGQVHRATLGSLPEEVLRHLLEVCRERISELKRDPRIRYVEVFQNQGRQAGALINHPHAQIIAAPMVPARVERELRATRAHFQVKERCLYCDLLRQEIAEQQRVVELTDDYVAFCPFASRFPYEVWILPRRHLSAFEEVDSNRLSALAPLFQSVFRRLETVTPTLSFVLHTEPNRRLPPVLRQEWETLSDDYHWHIEITPILRQRLKALPQQEFYLNQVLPEEAARQLRNL